MQAAILAGGLGTRLGAVVGDVPKPMAPILGKPFLEYQLLALQRGAIERVVLCVGYRAEIIRDYFGNGSRLGIEICYSMEPRPLGTAGALKHAQSLLDPTFLAVNGDTFADLDYEQLLRFHRERASQATIAVTAAGDPSAGGNVMLRPDGKVESFREKRLTPGSLRQEWRNAGVYVLERSILGYVPPGRPVSLEQESFPLLLARGELVYGYRVSGYFIDIGTPLAYRQFERDVKEGRMDALSQ